MEQDYQQLFVGGDLSGIQKFLYNISSKKAAVSLKGRSYYLQQYMENVCSKIKDAVNQAGAKNTEVIYNSGGKFYFLTDNGEPIRTAIAQCAKLVQENLWQEHKGQLGISIRSTKEIAFLLIQKNRQRVNCRFFLFLVNCNDS